MDWDEVQKEYIDALLKVASADVEITAKEKMKALELLGKVISVQQEW